MGEDYRLPYVRPVAQQLLSTLRRLLLRNDQRRLVRHLQGVRGERRAHARVLDSQLFVPQFLFPRTAALLVAGTAAQVSASCSSSISWTDGKVAAPEPTRGERTPPAAFELAYVALTSNSRASPSVFWSPWQHCKPLTSFPRKPVPWRVDAVVNHPYVHATALLGVQINELLTCASHVLGIVLVAMNLGRIAEIRRRWAEYAVTAGILEISILVGFGVRDFYALLLVFTLNIGLQASGGLTLDELRARLTSNSPFYQQQRGVLLAQSFVFLGVQIAYTMTTALEAGTPGLGGTLVASSVLYACFYASFGVLQTLSHCVPEFDAGGTIPPCSSYCSASPPKSVFPGTRCTCSSRFSDKLPERRSRASARQCRGCTGRPPC